MELVSTFREQFEVRRRSAAAALQSAHEALEAEESDATVAVFLESLAEFDRLQGAFPFVAAGAADEEA